MEPLFKPKIITVLKEGYDKKSFLTDSISGIIVGIVALPLAIAFAIASGVSPEKGLITAIVAGFLISLLGGSRVQIGGPTGAFVVVVFGIVEKYGLEGLMISTLMAGVMLIIFGLFRFGSVIKIVPYPLIVGFTSGIALIIFSSQIKDLMGLSIEKVPSGFIEKWTLYCTHFNQVNLYAFGIAIVTILITVYWSKLVKAIPGSFIAIILATIVANVFAWPVETIESVYGEIPTNFSFGIPSVSFSNIIDYVVPAFTIAMLGAIESLLSSVVADGMIGGSHRSNTELIGQGIANIASSLFGGIPATGAIARTATNVKNGARTPVSGLVHAITLLLIMLLFGKWATKIPLACLAGILAVVAWNMSEMKSFYSILKGPKYDVLILLTTFVLTVLVDLTVAIQIGVVMSALLFMQRMAKTSNISLSESDKDSLEDYSDLPKGVDVYEINGPFFFAAAQKYKETLKDISHNSKVLILRMRNVPFIDATGIHSFKETISELEKRKVKIILSGVQPDVKKDLEKSGIIDLIGHNMVCDNFQLAKEIVTKGSYSLSLHSHSG